MNEEFIKKGKPKPATLPAWDMAFLWHQAIDARNEAESLGSVNSPEPIKTAYHNLMAAFTEFLTVVEERGEKLAGDPELFTRMIGQLDEERRRISEDLDEGDGSHA